MLLSTDKNIGTKLLKLWEPSSDVKNVNDLTIPRVHTWSGLRSAFDSYLKVHEVSKETREEVLRKIAEVGPVGGIEYIVGYVSMKRTPYIVSIMLVRMAGELLSEVMDSEIAIGYAPVPESQPLQFTYFQSWGRMLMHTVTEDDRLEDTIICYYEKMYETRGMKSVIHDIIKTASYAPKVATEGDRFKQFIKIWSILYNTISKEEVEQEKECSKQDAYSVIAKLWSEPKMREYPRVYSTFAMQIAKELYSSGSPEVTISEVANWIKEHSLDEKEGCALLAGLLVASDCADDVIADNLYLIACKLIDSNISINIRSVKQPLAITKLVDYLRIGKDLLVYREPVYDRIHIIN